MENGGQHVGQEDLGLVVYLNLVRDSEDNNGKKMKIATHSGQQV